MTMGVAVGESSNWRSMGTRGGAPGLRGRDRGVIEVGFQVGLVAVDVPEWVEDAKAASAWALIHHDAPWAKKSVDTWALRLGPVCVADDWNSLSLGGDRRTVDFSSRPLGSESAHLPRCLPHWAPAHRTGQSSGWERRPRR